MHRYILVAASLTAISLAMQPTAPAFAVSAKQKMETCKFGADSQKLAAPQRAEFIKRCMANRNDPRGPAVGTPGAGASEEPMEEPQPKN